MEAMYPPSQSQRYSLHNICRYQKIPAWQSYVFFLFVVTCFELNRTQSIPHQAFGYFCEQKGRKIEIKEYTCLCNVAKVRNIHAFYSHAHASNSLRHGSNCSHTCLCTTLVVGGLHQGTHQMNQAGKNMPSALPPLCFSNISLCARTFPKWY